MTQRNNPLTSLLAHESVKPLKVNAIIREVYVEPDYEFVASCPYCGVIRSEEIEDTNCTIKVKCYGCKKDYKIKIPK